MNTININGIEYVRKSDVGSSLLLSLESDFIHKEGLNEIEETCCPVCEDTGAKGLC